MRKSAVALAAIPLLLASAAFAVEPPPPLHLPAPKLSPPGKDYPITNYGAVGDGSTLNTQAIQKAIDACAAAGGGTVVVPAGTFYSGAIFVKPHVNLRIDKGGILKGSTNPADYPIINSRWEGIERPWMAAFVNVTDCDGVTVGGGGVIDGSGDLWLRNLPRYRGRGRGRGAAARAGAARASAASSPGGPANPTTYPAPQTTFTGPRTVLTPTTTPPPDRLPGYGPMKPRLICFTNCSNSAVENLTLRNQAIWCVHLLYCTDFLARNLTIRDPNRNVPSSDGMDIDSCNRVTVDHVDIDCNDDCISIKSGKDADGRRVNRPSQFILIENSHFAYGQGGVAMGSEVSGGIHDVEVRDCTSDTGNWAPIRFKSQPTRGGTVQNIVYRNFKLSNTRQAFEFNLAWNMRNNNPTATFPTTIKNVFLINITGDVNRAGAINGMPGHPIRDVYFDNCTLTANTGLVLNNTQDIDTSGLKLTVKQGAPIIHRQGSAPAGRGRANSAPARTPG